MDVRSVLSARAAPRAAELLAGCGGRREGSESSPHQMDERLAHSALSSSAGLRDYADPLLPRAGGSESIRGLRGIDLLPLLMRPERLRARRRE